MSIKSCSFNCIASGIILFGIMSAGETLNAGDRKDQALARMILADKDLTDVLDRARKTIGTGLNAGGGYGEVWIRDLATFIELACDVHDPKVIRENLIMFFRFQGENGNIIDGFIPASQRNTAYDYICKKNIPGFLGHKNTVETDQESSLIQAVARYVRSTGDDTLFDEVIDGRTVKQRMALALEFLLRERFSKKYGLLWGATTADWGDVQPEHKWGVVLDEHSHRAIDIYDNAMFLVALADYIALTKNDLKAVAYWTKIRKDIYKNVRQHLWDEKRTKFVPHIYLGNSPFPATFDENAIYYHGGTAIAIEADLLSRDEISRSLSTMLDNVSKAGAKSIGLTLYPSYPAGYFKNPIMAQPYSYQNGGDWTWFGGRMIQQLIRNGFIKEAYRELSPMLKRVNKNDGFYEWYTLDGKPSGSGTYRGSAGVLAKAIQMLQAWAQEEQRHVETF